MGCGEEVGAGPAGFPPCRAGPVFEEAAFNISRPSAAAEISLAAFEHRFGD